MSHVEFDHVAIAVRRWDVLLHRYATELGGTFRVTGEREGTASLHIRFRSGATLEVLQPRAVDDDDDFLPRFLTRHGEGPHHLTFETPHVAEFAASVQAAGFSILKADFANSIRSECFLAPKGTQGILIQVKWIHLGMDESKPAPEWYPPPVSHDSDLVHVCHAVADHDLALRLYVDQLGAAVVGSGDDRGRWTDVEWAGVTLRVWRPDVDDELGPNGGRIRHLHFAMVRPWLVRDAVRVGDCWEVDEAHNVGMRLRLSERTG